MRRIQYNLTPQQEAATAMLGGKIPDKDPLIADRFSRVNRLFGSNDPSQVSSGEVGVAPWPGAARNKKKPLFDKQTVREALSLPASEKDVRPQDPRQLHATQPGITKSGVEYYMGDEYEETGKTFADQGNAGNMRPVVYHRNDGQSLILSGHHRADAALLQGRQFDAQHVFGE